MAEDTCVEILKNAILLEKRGQAFYSTVAQQASGKAVREFFEMMAAEEVRHVEILAGQFRDYQAKKEFTPVDDDQHASEKFASAVLSRELKEQISAAGYEAAAIAAAMSMEKNAIALYAQRAREAVDPNEKALYGWLADWERQHLKYLAAIDRELTEEIWHDNSFWPF